MGRAPCCDKANVKRGPWSTEEDAKLKSYIEKHGTGGNWIALPQKIGLKRCGKSCRLRWLNYLRPNIKHGGFTEDEDNFICNLYISIGSRWSVIAAQLPGRTDNDIKNYWNTKLKKKLLAKQRIKQLEINNKKRGENYYSINEYCFNPYPPPVVVPPSLPVGYTTLETRPREQTSNSLTNIPINTPFESRFSYDHPRLNENINGEIFENFCSISNVYCSQHQLSNFQGTSGGAAINLQEFDHGITEDIMYSTVSPGFSTNCGDINSCQANYTFDHLSNYEVLQKKITQLDWSLYDEQRF